MVMDRDDEDSDAPEEFSIQQGLEQDKELRKAEQENKSRVAREGKERRRRWAQRKTPRKSEGDGGVKELTEAEPHQEAEDGMLPADIVNALVAREKQVFLSDSEEDDIKEKTTARKKKPKTLGPETVILKEIPSAQCLQNSLEFLKMRKMQVSRSSSVLNNSNQALRLISTCSLLSKK
ncbi:hypothetical protein BVC80_8893g22 [Macleaya cordata]|uniref:Uncharacterized protein n=1 Tax=Macleaya cordata TaxID=56857 RepID=A0A200Q3Z3_MACCD|nr:hypothetical protein BVC80_8893g22 [Macleaya cordata]